MSTYKKQLILIPLFLFTLLSWGLYSQDSGSGHKIVMQLTDGSAAGQKALTNQLKNIMAVWPKAEIEVVVHSAGITYLQKSQTPHAAEIASLSKLGVHFVACENTMEAKKIPKSDILDIASFVPMGIGEIVMKQEEGWSYIKAGL